MRDSLRKNIKKKHSFCIIRKFISEDTPREVFSEVHLRRHPHEVFSEMHFRIVEIFFKKKSASEVHFRSRDILGGLWWVVNETRFNFKRCCGGLLMKLDLILKFKSFLN